MLVNIRFSECHIWKPSQRPQKSNRFNNNFALAWRFFLHFFAVAARLIRGECAEFHGGRKHKTTTFFFFFFSLTSMQSLGFNPWKICKHLTIWRRWDNREFTCKWRVKLRHVIYVWLVILSYPFLILVRNMVLAKVNIFTSRARYKANIRLQIWLQLQMSTPYEFLVHARMLYF